MSFPIRSGARAASVRPERTENLSFFVALHLTIRLKNDLPRLRGMRGGDISDLSERKFDMLKLFASDVDGTLLMNGETALGENAQGLISALLSAGVSFAAVSGRDIFSLRRIFNFAREKIFFAACGGAICVRAGHTLFSRPVSAESVRRALKQSRESGEGAVFCTEKALYVNGGAELFDYVSESSGGMAKRINTLPDIKEPVCKISFYSKNFVRGLNETPFDLRVFNERSGWKEYINRFADKGTALSELQARTGIYASDTASAGNEASDGAMLLRSAYRFAFDDSLANDTGAVRFHSPEELLKLTLDILKNH